MCIEADGGAVLEDGGDDDVVEGSGLVEEFEVGLVDAGWFDER